MKTYNDIYLSTRNILRQNGVEGYALEARILVACAAGKTVQQLLRDINLYTTEQVENTVLDRLRGEPVAYITGSWEFYGLPMTVTPDVLIPRMDTEVLVDAVKEFLTGYKMDARVLDLCCGSGCITCAIGHELPATKLVAVDLSASALEVCRQNIAKNRLSSRVICMQADATSSPPLGIGSFDVIVSNPPYLTAAEMEQLQPEVAQEPAMALEAGEDGLVFYRAIAEHYQKALRPGGALALGINSGAYVSEIIRGGLMAVDPGQMEAGRSLGLNYMTTMFEIIIPQAIRSILPALGNEFIMLLKDSSLITVIGGKELLYAAQGIMNRTYEAMFPLLGVALIYLILVMLFTWLLSKFERRLAQSDRG